MNNYQVVIINKIAEIDLFNYTIRLCSFQKYAGLFNKTSCKANVLGQNLDDRMLITARIINQDPNSSYMLQYLTMTQIKENYFEQISPQFMSSGHQAFTQEISKGINTESLFQSQEKKKLRKTKHLKAQKKPSKDMIYAKLWLKKSSVKQFYTVFFNRVSYDLIQHLEDLNINYLACKKAD